MRIAVVCQVLQPSGMFHWASGWAQGLISVGHEVTVIFAREGASAGTLRSLFSAGRIEFGISGTSSRLSSLSGLPVLGLPGLRNAFPRDSAPDPVTWAVMPFRGAWKDRFDLVICSDPLVGLSGLLALKFAEVPYVVFVHELLYVWDPFPLRIALRAWQSSVLRNARMRCATTSKIAIQAETASGLPFRVLEHGCNPSAAIEREKGAYVLTDTRWSAARHPFLLLDVAERVPGVRFVVAGSFSSQDLEQRFVTELGRRGLKGRVEVRLGLPESEVRELYRRATCYLRWPGFGLGGHIESGPSFGVYLALEQGCPIVVTDDLSTAASLHSERAALTCAHDPDAIARTIEDLFGDDQEIRELSWSSWSLAKKWSWGRRAAGLLREVGVT